MAMRIPKDCLQCHHPQGFEADELMLCFLFRQLFSESKMAGTPEMKKPSLVSLNPPDAAISLQVSSMTPSGLSVITITCLRRHRMPNPKTLPDLMGLKAFQLFVFPCQNRASILYPDFESRGAGLDPALPHPMKAVFISLIPGLSYNFG